MGMLSSSLSLQRLQRQYGGGGWCLWIDDQSALHSENLGVFTAVSLEKSSEVRLSRLQSHTQSQGAVSSDSVIRSAKAEMPVDARPPPCTAPGHRLHLGVQV